MPTTFSMTDNDMIKAVKPGPDREDIFAAEELRKRYDDAVDRVETAKVYVNEVIDLMQAVNDSKDIDVTIEDIPAKL